MSEPDSPADAWLEAQRRYWDAWLDMTRKALDGAAPARPSSPWSEALEQWRSSLAVAAPPPARGLLDQLVQLGKAYFSMADGLTGTEAAERWSEQLSQSFQSMTAPFSRAADRRGGIGEFLAFWELPLHTWERTASAFAPLPGDILQALHREAGEAPDLRAHLDRFLSMPAVGYGRESQERVQSLHRAVLAYQEALREYAAGYADMGSEAARRFQAKLAEAGERGQPARTLRALYDTWVDACEEVYAEYALSDEYARRYGAMVNALMALKRESGRLVDEWLETMNMPTRRELSTLQRRLHDTRREFHQLRAELEEVRAELAARRGAAKSPSSPGARPARGNKTSAGSRSKTRGKRKAP